MTVVPEAGRLAEAEQVLIQISRLGSYHAAPMTEHFRTAKEYREPDDGRESPS
ncbi:MAG: hypothetical protein AAGI63_13310 [Planctomycetota bacterium]